MECLHEIFLRVDRIILWSRDESGCDRCMSQLILIMPGDVRLTCGDLEIAEPFVLDELLYDHPCGSLK